MSVSDPWSNDFPPTFDVGTPGGGHMHFDSDGSQTLYGPDGVTVLLRITPQAGVEVLTSPNTSLKVAALGANPFDVSSDANIASQIVNAGSGAMQYLTTLLSGQTQDNAAGTGLTADVQVVSGSKDKSLPPKVSLLAGGTAASPAQHSATWDGSTFDVPGLVASLNAFFRGYNSAIPSIPNAVWTAVTYNVVSQRDFGYVAGSGLSRVFAPVTGEYHIDCGVIWSGASAVGTRAIAVFKNSGGVFGAGVPLLHVSDVATPIGGSNNSTSESGSTLVDMAVGDYLEAFVYQNSGGPLTVSGPDPWALRLSAHLVSS